MSVIVPRVEASDRHGFNTLSDFDHPSDRRGARLAVFARLGLLSVRWTRIGGNHHYRAVPGGLFPVMAVDWLQAGRPAKNRNGVADWGEITAVLWRRLPHGLMGAGSSIACCQHRLLTQYCVYSTVEGSVH